MPIPLTNLKPTLAETQDAWSANLERLLGDMQFVLGRQGEEFERDFAVAVGSRFAVGVASGTAAIELCLREAGVTERSRHVLTSPLTSPFTGLAILAAGASPRFSDVDEETLLLDAGEAENRLDRRTAALLPVHLYGQPCEMARFALLARRANIPLVQDACQADGARYRGRALTEFSPYVAYSFYPTNNLGCLGDGGAVVTGKKVVAGRLRLLRDGGRGANHVSKVAGINARLDEMQCCFLRAFLPRLSDWNARRARIAALYDQALAGCEGVRMVRRGSDSVHHLYVIRAKKRDRLRTHLAKRGIGTGVHFAVPLHLHPAFAACRQKRGDLPKAEAACREVVSLPLWPHLPEGAVGMVADAVREFYGGGGIIPVNGR